MNSKEAFQLVSNKVRNTTRWYENELILIQQDLEKLENLEKENQELLVNKNVAQGIATKLKEENTKLKKVIEVFKSFKIILKDDGNELYTLKFAFDIYGLTPEEYKLLKEVFENEY